MWLARWRQQYHTEHGTIVDLTSGSIWKILFRYALPVFLQHLLQTLFNVTDSFWVGRLVGANALASVTLAGYIVTVAIAVMTGLSMAALIRTAREAGAHHVDAMRRQMTLLMKFMLLIAAALSAVGLLSTPFLLHVIAAPDVLRGEAQWYLAVVFSGLVLTGGTLCMTNMMLGMGDVVTPLLFSIIVTAFNLLIDPLLIDVLGLGVVGAGIGTVLAQGILFALCLMYMRRNRLIDWKHMFSRHSGDDNIMVRKWTKLGVPMALQQGLLAASGMMMSALINPFGETVVAAFGAAEYFEDFAFLPAIAMASAVTAISGQSLGAHKPERAIRSFWNASLIVCVAAITSFAFVQWNAEWCIRIFVDEALHPGVLEKGAQHLRTVSFMFVAYGVMCVAKNFVNASGHSLFTLINAVVITYVVRLPLAHWLANVQGLGPQGIYLAITIAPYVGLVAMLVYIAHGRWRIYKPTS